MKFAFCASILFCAIFSALFGSSAYAQIEYRLKVVDSTTNEPLIGATIYVDSVAVATTDEEGKTILILYELGNKVLKVTFVGAAPKTFRFADLNKNGDEIIIFLSPKEEEEDEPPVVISSTRSSRSIASIPTRVEFIAGEELEEKANMKAGDIRMVLSESTGIQIQQTSATSANASIRIQGLDGRYTQLLKDGFPLYAGAASGLGLLQTPPLDLKQVEVIKGSASTLYGGGAIAGLVNLISKTPSFQKEARVTLNLVSSLGGDVSAFYSKRNQKFGTTLFATHSRNEAYNPASINFSAIPKFERWVFNPKLFYYPSNKTTLMLGFNGMVEERLGGDMEYINGDRGALGGNTRFFENNESQRYSTQLAVDHRISPTISLHFKNSLAQFNRLISIPNYLFEGDQFSTFSELTANIDKGKSDWVVGANAWTEDFNDEDKLISSDLSYNQSVAGLFVQNLTEFSKKWSLESGVRYDLVEDYKGVFLPRLALLYRPTARLNARAGGGLGYKTPTPFTEESERLQFQLLRPVTSATNSLENSYGVNGDVNYVIPVNKDLVITFNQLFYYTFLDRPLELVSSGGTSRLLNSNGHIDTRGAETNVKITYKDFKLFLGYTFTDARKHVGDVLTEMPLTPRNRINAVLMYEVDEKWKLGLESYTFSKQQLSDGAVGQSYVLCGFMAEKLWERFSIYINFENFLDARQTRFDTIYAGSVTNPNFRDIYAPLDGFLVNGGIKLKL